MATTPAAKKSIRQSEKRRKRNKKRKDEMKELTKKVRDLVNQGKEDEAEELLPEVYKAIDKAAKNNVIKDNAAARKKSKIASWLNQD